MAVLTVYPSLDGYVYDNGVQALSWAEIIAEPGSSAKDDGTSGAVINISAKPSETDKWMTLYRSIFLFDTSALPDGCRVTSAIFSVWGTNKADALSVAPDINVYASAPASTTALAAGDFDSLGSTPFCDTPITYAGWNTSGYNDFTLNAAGIAAISKTGITKLGLRNANYDVAGVAPNWVSGAGSTLGGYFVEHGSGGRPKLVITYGAPTVTTQAVTAITGTTATGNGNITDLGDPNPTAHGVCYSTTEMPTIADSTTDEGAASATGAFTTSMTNLTPGTLYYVRAYATNAAGTGYGQQVSFTAGAPGSGELAGLYAVVEERFHYVDAYGQERYIQGTVVG